LLEQFVNFKNISKGFYNMPLEKNFFKCQKNSNMQTPNKKGIQNNITILRGWVKVQQVPSPRPPNTHTHNTHVTPPC
jgi:hypothetical protein